MKKKKKKVILAGFFQLFFIINSKYCIDYFKFYFKFDIFLKKLNLKHIILMTKTIMEAWLLVVVINNQNLGSKYRAKNKIFVWPQ